MRNLPSHLLTKSARRVTLDLDRLIADGKLAEADATRIEQLGEPSPFKRLISNTLLIFGAIMVVAGVIAFEPPLDFGLALALGSVGIGSAILYVAREEWGYLAQTLVLMGFLGISGWLVLRAPELGGMWPDITWPAITVLMLGGAFIFRNAVLAVLAPLAFGVAIGGGTAYWHASYALFMEEAVISLTVFGLLGTLLFAIRSRVAEGLQTITIVMARTSFFLANFAFWIGSLWGDYPGEMWVTESYNYEAITKFHEKAFFVPDTVFAFAWAVFLVAALVAGVKTGRRFLANTSIVFLAIHFYTQLYESLGETPAALLLGGLFLIGLGVVIVRFNKWLTEQEDSAVEPSAVMTAKARDVIDLAKAI